jgi:hypothetical protein
MRVALKTHLLTKLESRDEWKKCRFDPRLLKSQIWTINEICTGSGSKSNQSALEDGVIQAHGSSQSFHVVLKHEAHIILSNLKIGES